MLFASIQFILFFLPAILLAYWSIEKNRPQNIFLLIASVLFYFWGESWHIVVLLVSVVLSYFGARWIVSVANQNRRNVLLIAVAMQLGLLILFKYSAFMAQTLNQLFGLVEFGWQIPIRHVHLPLGISFFVFHGISYLIDCYRGQIVPEKRFSVVALYFFLFPHQVAGPIVRYEHFALNVDRRNFNLDEIRYGLERFIIGLSKKVLVANSAARGADAIFALPTQDLSTPLSWVGALCYTIQIYFDFSGYSDMAIGLARMLGFHFHENFNFPYAAKSVTDFWRRWHISLSTWFRDYVYIPLGGNRVSPIRNYFNLIIVFSLCGFWHGANWTFLVWGLWHGVFLVLERSGLCGAILRSNILGRIWTLLVVIVGWVWFRSDSLAHGSQFITRMFTFNMSMGDSDFQTRLIVDPIVILGLFAGIVFASGRAGKLMRNELVKRSGGAVYVALLLFTFILVMSRLAGATFNPFIYFRF